MKTATVRQVQHRLSEVLAYVERGEEVRVLRRRKVVARLVPPQPEVIASPNFVVRAQAIWGKGRGKALSRLVADARGSH